MLDHNDSFCWFDLEWEVHLCTFFCDERHGRYLSCEWLFCKNDDMKWLTPFPPFLTENAMFGYFCLRILCMLTINRSSKIKLIFPFLFIRLAVVVQVVVSAAFVQAVQKMKWQLPHIIWSKKIKNPQSNFITAQLQCTILLFKSIFSFAIIARIIKQSNIYSGGVWAIGICTMGWEKEKVRKVYLFSFPFWFLYFFFSMFICTRHWQ